MTASDLIRKIDPEVHIVAMTADAISGVEEMCRSHGIRNYVSKPFEPDQLIETLITLLDGREPKLPPKQERKTEEPEGIVDFQDGIKRMGGDKALYVRVLQSFLKESEGVAAQTEKALETNDFALGEQIAHKMKGSAGSIGAKKLQAASLELQMACKEGNTKAVPQLAIAFYDRLAKTLQALAEFEAQQK